MDNDAFGLSPLLSSLAVGNETLEIHGLDAINKMNG